MLCYLIFQFPESQKKTSDMLLCYSCFNWSIKVNKTCTTLRNCGTVVITLLHTAVTANNYCNSKTACTQIHTWKLHISPYKNIPIHNETYGDKLMKAPLLRWVKVICVSCLWRWIITIAIADYISLNKDILCHT